MKSHKILPYLVELAEQIQLNLTVAITLKPKYGQRFMVLCNLKNTGFFILQIEQLREINGLKQLIHDLLHCFKKNM